MSMRRAYTEMRLGIYFLTVNNGREIVDDGIKHLFCD